MLKICYATKKDSATILTLIKELAAYEQLEDQVVATISDIENSLFIDNPKAFVLLAYEQEKIVGFALYFHNYSTFLCKYGIYIEDIYIREEYRGKKYGKELLKKICQIAVEKDCGRVEWWCLDWNKKSIDFYLKLGALPMEEWTVYRLTRDKIENLLD